MFSRNSSSAMKNFNIITSIAMFDRCKATPRDGEILEGKIFMRTHYVRETNIGSCLKRRNHFQPVQYKYNPSNLSFAI